MQRLECPWEMEENQACEAKANEYEVERVFAKRGKEVFVLWKNYLEPGWVDVNSVKHLNVYKEWKQHWNGVEYQEEEEESEEEDSEKEKSEEEESCSEEESEEEDCEEEKSEEEDSEEEESCSEEESEEGESEEERKESRKRRSHYWMDLNQLKRRKMNPKL